MLFRTHVSILIFVYLLVVDKVQEPFLFFVVALFGTIIPDIDSGTSRVGRKGISKVIASFSKHRGIFHSLIFGLAGCVLIFFFWIKELAFAFAMGYFLHLFLDCFTKRGINLFWPFKFRIKGFLKSGGKLELLIFLVFAFINLGIFLYQINSLI